MKSRKIKGLIGLVVLVALMTATVAFAQRGQEVILNEGTKITIRVNDHLSTKTSRENDRFSAEVISPVFYHSTVVIPTGSVINGRISHLKRPGRISGKGDMNLRFESIRLPNGPEETIVARISTVERSAKATVQKEGTLEGEGTKGRDAAVVGTAGGVGAGIGAIAGGAKGTAIGAGTGAIIGLATVFGTRGRDLEVARGTEFDIVLERPLRLPAKP